MSWNYAVHQINRSFEQIAQWYHEFMHRAEMSFRALHQRVEYLEQRQAWQGPSDEQVERVLRKILAERFADAGVQHVQNPNKLKEDEYFVKRPDEDASTPRTIPISAAMLQVDSEAVPSKAYGQTFQMLESRLRDFPQTDVGKSAQKEANPDEAGFKRPKLPAHSNHPKPSW